MYSRQDQRHGAATSEAYVNREMDEPIFSTAREILRALGQPPKKFLHQLPSRERGRNAMEDIQHACQLHSWWMERLYMPHALDPHEPDGLWTLLQQPAGGNAWTNLRQLLEALHLSAFPLLRAVCAVFARVSASQPRSDSQHHIQDSRNYNYSDDDDDPAECLVTASSTVRQDIMVLYCVSPLNFVRIVENVVQELMLCEGSTLKPLLTSFTEQKIDSEREDVIHWMWSMQHSMHIKLSPQRGNESWRDVGQSVLDALCDVLFSPIQAEKHILAQSSKAAQQRYEKAERSFREKHATSLKALANSITPSWTLEAVRPEPISWTTRQRLAKDSDKFQQKWSQKLSQARTDATTQFNDRTIASQILKSDLLCECEQRVAAVSIDDLRTSSINQPFTTAYLQQEALDQTRTSLLRRKKSSSAPDIGLKGRNSRDAMRLQEAKGRHLLWRIPVSYVKHSAASDAVATDPRYVPRISVPAPLAQETLAAEMIQSRQDTYSDSESNSESEIEPESEDDYDHGGRAGAWRQDSPMSTSASQTSRIQIQELNTRRLLNQIRHQISERKSSQQFKRAKRPHPGDSGREQRKNEHAAATMASANDSKRHRHK